jgi:hypothetical protein
VLALIHDKQLAFNTLFISRDTAALILPLTGKSIALSLNKESPTGQSIARHKNLRRRVTAGLNKGTQEYAGQGRLFSRLDKLRDS